MRGSILAPIKARSWSKTEIAAEKIYHAPALPWERQGIHPCPTFLFFWGGSTQQAWRFAFRPTGRVPSTPVHPAKGHSLQGDLRQRFVGWRTCTVLGALLKAPQWLDCLRPKPQETNKKQIVSRALSCDMKILFHILNHGTRPKTTWDLVTKQIRQHHKRIGSAAPVHANCLQSLRQLPAKVRCHDRLSAARATGELGLILRNIPRNRVPPS